MSMSRYASDIRDHPMVRQICPKIRIFFRFSEHRLSFERNFLSRRSVLDSRARGVHSDSGGIAPLLITDCNSTYSCRPSGPNSRPMPDCLKPPKGLPMSSVYMLIP